MQYAFFLEIELREDDQSKAAVNKITAHTSSYNLLIQHRLPAASCHTLSVGVTENLQSAEDFGGIKGKQ